MRDVLRVIGAASRRTNSVACRAFNAERLVAFSGPPSPSFRGARGRRSAGARVRDAPPSRRQEAPVRNDRSTHYMYSETSTCVSFPGHERRPIATLRDDPVTTATNGSFRMPPTRPFPRRTVEEALAVPTALKDKNGGNPWSTDEVAKALQVARTNNKFFYLTAASRDYGFTLGTRDAAEISLTDLGRKAVYPSSPDAEYVARLEGFLRIEVFQLVLKHFGGSSSQRRSTWPTPCRHSSGSTRLITMSSLSCSQQTADTCKSERRSIPPALRVA